jgi:hypothetical protein
LVGLLVVVGVGSVVGVTEGVLLDWIVGSAITIIEEVGVDSEAWTTG